VPPYGGSSGSRETPLFVADTFPARFWDDDDREAEEPKRHATARAKVALRLVLLWRENRPTTGGGSRAGDDDWRRLVMVHTLLLALGELKPTLRGQEWVYYCNVVVDFCDAPTVPIQQDPILFQ
jgi:hypothetical protein